MFKPSGPPIATMFLLAAAVAALGLYSEGCSSARKARRPPAAQWPDHLADVRTHLQADRLSRARAALETAREQGASRHDADHLGAAIERKAAHATLDDGRPRAAFGHFVRAADLEPNDGRRASDLLAGIDAGKKAGVLPATLAPLASRAVEANVQSRPAQTEAAHLWDDAGNSQRALPYYQWLHKVAADNTSISLRLATLYLGQDQLRAAQRLFETVHDRHPDNALVALKLADISARLAEYARARSLYESLLEDYPDRPSVLRKYGAFLAERGEADRARQLLGRARRAQPAIERRQMRRLR